MTEVDQPPPSAESRAVAMQVNIDLNGISGRVSRPEAHHPVDSCRPAKHR